MSQLRGETSSSAKFADELCEKLRGKRVVFDVQGMPSLPNFQKVLVVSDDLLLVRVNDMVRKAMDEMALGLQWYILFTMVHSSVVAKDTGRKIWFGGFKAAGSELPRSVIRTDSENDMHHDIDWHVKTYMTDLRTQFKHIYKLNAKENGGRWHFSIKGCKGHYYPGKPAEDTKILQALANYFFHRNGIVRRRVVLDKENGFEEVSQRDDIVADCFMTRICNWLKPLIREGRHALHVIENKPSFITGSKLDAVRDLLEAAIWHFNTVLDIVNKSYPALKEVLIQGKGESISSDLVEEYLHTLREKLEIDTYNGNSTSRHVCFGLFMLWTRFPPIPNQTEHDTDKQHNGVKNLSRKASSAESSPNEFEMVRVKRHRLATLEEVQSGTPFVISHQNFTADPLGETHLDIINRMLDITHLGLRSLLIAGAAAYSKQCLGGGTEACANFHVRNHIVEEALHLKCGLDGKLLVPDFFVIDDLALTETNIGLFKTEYGDKNVEFFRYFARRNDVSNIDGPLEKLVQLFVEYDPHFGDPRFVAEFLKRIRHPCNHHNLFPEADYMIKVRDRAMHQYHLKDPSHTTIDELTRHLSVFHGLLISLASSLQVSTDIDPIKALVEMKTLLVHYQNWRQRQQLAFNMAPSNRPQEALHAVNSLIKRTGSSIIFPSLELQLRMFFKYSSTKERARASDLFASAAAKAMFSNFDSDDSESENEEEEGG